MIRILLGQPGTGKTITAVKFVVDSKIPCFTNFAVKSKNCIRLKWEHIITYEKNNKGENVNPKLNWKFWREQIKKHGGFHVVIDELHNLMHARRAMSKTNVLLSTWVAQIRKITGANEHAHFIVISQELERIDVSVRDLANDITLCDKRQRGHASTKVKSGKKYVTVKVPQTYIRLTHFNGGQCTERYRVFRDTGNRTHDYRSYFYANPYMYAYDSYELIDFGMEEYL